jgi:hypothetical protein
MEIIASFTRAVPLTLHRFALRSILELALRSDSEDCRKRGLAAGALKLIGREPKGCSMLAARNTYSP